MDIRQKATQYKLGCKKFFSVFNENRSELSGKKRLWRNFRCLKSSLVLSSVIVSISIGCTKRKVEVDGDNSVGNSRVGEVVVSDDISESKKGRKSSLNSETLIGAKESNSVLDCYGEKLSEKSFRGLELHVKVHPKNYPRLSCESIARIVGESFELLQKVYGGMPRENYLSLEVEFFDLEKLYESYARKYAPALPSQYDIVEKVLCEGRKNDCANLKERLLLTFNKGQTRKLKYSFTYALTVNSENMRPAGKCLIPFPAPDPSLNNVGASLLHDEIASERIAVCVSALSNLTEIPDHYLKYLR